ncbi:hypothetical protein BC828DRAFT_376188 [Blastocladiella britannica]|nr:hypothetical protein BC828DRAFT_376188 [Blastocladiella britannica]
MTRGNQRDLARAKNQKKQQELTKAKGKAGDPTKRMESDAEIMRQKQQAAEAKRQEAAAASASGSGSVKK